MLTSARPSAGPPWGLLTIPAGVALGPMGSQCKARRRCLAVCQARSRNAAMGAQWPEPCGLRPNGPATALRSLPRGRAIGGVARLVAEPFGHNAIPRRDCQQTLGLFPRRLSRYHETWSPGPDKPA